MLKKNFHLNDVSIPYRDDKNNKVFIARILFAFSVSIPYRDDKNLLPPITHIHESIEFQSLIGTIKTFLM